MDAFDKAIESTIDFRNLFKWFRNQEDIENQIKVRNDSDYEDKSLAAVKKAMLAMLDGFEDIRIERRPLAMKVNKNGKSLKIDQLSDGEKCTIALFGDLARRMALANPGKDVNPLEGSGVVLIDELDLHMHTSWQRKVLNVLRDTFPISSLLLLHILRRFWVRWMILSIYCICIMKIMRFYLRPMNPLWMGCKCYFRGSNEYVFS